MEDLVEVSGSSDKLKARKVFMKLVVPHVQMVEPPLLVQESEMSFNQRSALMP